MKLKLYTGSLSTVVAALTVFGCGGAAKDANSPSSQPIDALGTMTAGDAGSKGGEILRNGNFDEGVTQPWNGAITPPAKGKYELKDKQLCFTMDKPGKNPWDIVLRQRPLKLTRHHEYTFRMKVSSTAPSRVKPSINLVSSGNKPLWSAVVEAGPTAQVYSATFKAEERIEGDAELVLQMGGALGASEPYTVCLDDLSLQDPELKATESATASRPKVRVNQLGYVPSWPKHATVKNASEQPLDWKLLDANGKAVASGKTKVFGADKDAGEFLHTVEFSSYTQPGKGFVLEVGQDKSPPFEIGTDLYAKAKVDAIKFYYQNRSGIAIQMPYAGGEQWTRPAGHLSDKSVPCGPGTGCSYSLDVSGGWYDAGDHGKYLVNGGITVWTLLNLWERTKFLGTSIADFGDGKLNLPESGNGVPDLLDEVRWELEFEMKMQVPEGNKLAGMAHHKIHSVEWTPIPTRPDQDTVKRTLRPPSTTATLNLAANMAQAARIWAKIDPAFAAKCKDSALRAWKAALANPKVAAPGDDFKSGGGAYGDPDPSDEFYWAAAELYITTGDQQFLDYAKKSKHWLQVPVSAGGGNTSMAWDSMKASGTISLATVPSNLPKEDVEKARAAVVKAADDYLADSKKLGYRVPFEATGGRFPWGSNSFVLNNAMILGLAYDFTKKKDYLYGAADALDYIFGRNPNSQSYVTGYGAYPLQNPHHRFWAHQANPEFPVPPPGIVSGGPNSGLEDPKAQEMGLGGCAPEQCFLDDHESWSTNEIAINWNAPLAWVLSFVDEQEKSK